MAEKNAHDWVKKLRHLLRLDKLPKPVRKGVVCFAGFALIIGGVVLIILPIVPGFFFIPLGLLLLATEFKWAEQWADKVHDWATQAREKWRARRRRRAAQAKS